MTLIGATHAVAKETNMMLDNLDNVPNFARAMALRGGI